MYSFEYHIIMICNIKHLVLSLCLIVKETIMEKKEKFINNIFVVFLVVYGLVINFHLMLSMSISFITTMILFECFGLTDDDMVDSILMNKEPTEEMLEKYMSILRIMLILFAVLTAIFYNWFMK